MMSGWWTGAVHTQRAILCWVMNLIDWVLRHWGLLKLSLKKSEAVPGERRARQKIKFKYNQLRSISASDLWPCMFDGDAYGSSMT